MIGESELEFISRVLVFGPLILLPILVYFLLMWGSWAPFVAADIVRRRREEERTTARKI